MDTRKAPKLGERVFRTATFSREAVNEEARTVELAFCSETGVDRWYGREILACEKKAVRLGRLMDGAPLLLDHNPERQIGVIENARIEGDKVGRALVRFSRSPLGEEIFQDVKDGIRRCVSVGYAVHKFEVDEDEEEYRATDWEPYEISIVSMPADTTVGVGRAAETPAVDTPARGMANETTPAQNTEAARTPTVQIDEAAVQAATKREITRRTEIEYLGERYDAREEAAKALRDNTPLDEFQTFIFREKANMRQVPVHGNADLGLSDKETKRFSLSRAILLRSAGKALDGFEAEVCDAAAKKYERQASPNGFIIPAEISRSGARAALQQRANQTASNFANGGALIQEEYGELIEYLRNATVTGRAGLSMISGLKGSFLMPVQTGSTTAYWVGENNAGTQSNATFGQKTMTPKTLVGFYDYSSQLLAQASVSVDNLVRADLQRTLAIAKDLAVLEGTGVAGQPLGIKNTSGINATVTFSNAPTWADVVEFETGIAADNADIGAMAFILSTTTVGKWKTVLKDSVAGAGYLIAPDMTANGYPVLRTNQITGNIAFFGVWNQLLLGMWGGQEVIVDNITQATQRLVRVSISEMCDVLARQPLAFNISTDSAAQ